jgi:hypothetical protein
VIVNAAELRGRANDEAADLGPLPLLLSERPGWIVERDGAIELLAAYADWDAAPLRQASLGVADAQADGSARDLLIEAAARC